METKILKATCLCGTQWEIATTASTLKIEICSNCHPAYKGVKNNVAHSESIEKFRKRYGQRQASKVL